MPSRRIILTLFATVALLQIGTGKTHAVNEFCKPDEGIFMKIGDAFKALDIRKTVNNMIASALTDSITNLIANRSPKGMMECSWYILNKEQTAATTTGADFKYAGLLGEINTQCPDIKATPNLNCDDFIRTYNSTDSGERGLAFNQTITSGSLLGMANTIEGVTRTEPLPTNLAYFWNDSIKKVPFAGTALAADVTYSNAPMIEVVLTIWKTSRNIAFAVLAIVMLVIGIMIMMRKKLSAQLVVTAQYALPRIALAVILIVFSYPIGAVLASSMRYITDLLTGVVWQTMPTFAPSIGAQAGIGLPIALLFATALGWIGIGIPMLVALGISLLVCLVLYIGVWIKAAFLYIKLIISIIFAPIQFALGAIPGNESMSQNWFKHAIANVLSFIAMFIYLNIGIVLVLTIITSPMNTLGGNIGSGFAIILAPAILVWILIQTLKVPDKIQAFIIGEPKRQGGKR